MTDFINNLDFIKVIIVGIVLLGGILLIKNALKLLGTIILVVLVLYLVYDQVGPQPFIDLLKMVGINV